MQFIIPIFSPLTANQQLSGLSYDAAAQYANAAAYNAALQNQAAYAYTTVPQPAALSLAANAAAAGHYGQPQQLQERMQ